MSNIGEYLQDKGIPRADITPPPMKTLIGMIARAILAEEGYARVERGVRTGADDTIFSTGSVYELVQAGEEDGAEADGNDKLVQLILAVSEKLLTGADRRHLSERLEEMD